MQALINSFIVEKDKIKKRGNIILTTRTGKTFHCYNKELVTFRLEQISDTINDLCSRHRTDKYTY